MRLGGDAGRTEVTDTPQGKASVLFIAPWDKETGKNMTEEAIQQYTEREYRQVGLNMSSLWWMPQLLEGELGRPPERFWVTSRYSAVARSATATRIKLLAGHSWVTSGIARRHATGFTLCPLCKQLEETLEHFLYDCAELKEEREIAEHRTGTKLPRTRTAVRSLMDDGSQDAKLIHQLYKARVEKELSQSPPHCPKSLQSPIPIPASSGGNSSHNVT